MIKNVIFDVGEVLINAKPIEYIKAFGFSDDITERIFKISFFSEQWKDFDKGLLEIDELINLMIKKQPELKNEIKQVFNENWVDEMLTPKKESVDFLKKLKSNKYYIYLLSNFPREPFLKVMNKNSFFSLVDGKVVSYEVNLIKPDPLIYKCILNKYSIIPNETVFIDDNLDNINAAKAFGIHTILFTSIEQLILDFNTLCESLK